MLLRFGSLRILVSGRLRCYALILVGLLLSQYASPLRYPRRYRMEVTRCLLYGNHCGAITHTAHNPCFLATYPSDPSVSPLPYPQALLADVSSVRLAERTGSASVHGRHV
ncbi:hypothetical protein C8Q70DRAFT_597128 [Cubamyces menziesii]|nr:hypothetical protein C8Q70DRAFT_597128 [Cubamyces menziesii]